VFGSELNWGRDVELGLGLEVALGPVLRESACGLVRAARGRNVAQECTQRYSLSSIAAASTAWIGENDPNSALIG
jgi:hypothetical protein